MDIVEIRVLEGPNYFLLAPAVKIELVATASERETLAQRLSSRASDRTGTDLADAWRSFVSRLTESSGAPGAQTTVVELDPPDHIGLAFSWTHRPFAKALASIARGVVLGAETDGDGDESRLREALAEPNDPPEMMADADRTALSVAITGTNGKTTTTRLLAHMARTAGRHVGWSSSSGVYVDGELVEAGDYSGPSGAGQVLKHGEIDLAILETARGGILLKGLGYESNDVSVFTNVSADHLGLNGVETVETLARVKATVCRVTRAEGTAVLNADDELVLAATADVRARRCLVSQRPDNPRLLEHKRRGRLAVELVDRQVVASEGSTELLRLPIDEVPICFGGKARHQVENTMSAVAAGLAADLPVDAILAGATSFGSDLDHNPGRLNVIEVGDYTVVLDYAHNEAGLRRLIAFGRELMDGGGRLVAVIGSAGDREPEMLRSLGRIAAEESDYVLIKGTERYLRGRDKDELFRLYREGAEQHPDTPHEEVADERAAVERIREIARPGDVFVLMFQELLGEVRTILGVEPAAQTS